MAVAALLASAALTGCGSSSDDASEGSGGDAAPKLKVMSFPNADPVLIPKVGIAQGFFEDEGLDVTYVEQPLNLDSYQALEATKSQITMTSSATMAAAASAGQDSLQYFCGNQPQNYQSLVARKDSDIPSVDEGATGTEILKALEGKTIGSATPAGSGYQKLLEAAIAEAGVKDVKYITVGTDPKVAKAALDRKQIDVAVTVSTAREVLELSGDVKHLMLMSEQTDIPIYHDLFGLAWAARATDIAADPEAYQAWCRAAETTMKYIVDSGPEKQATLIQDTLGVDAAIAEKVVEHQVYERYDIALPTDRIVSTFDKYADIGLIKAPLKDPARFVHTF